MRFEQKDIVRAIAPLLVLMLGGTACSDSGEAYRDIDYDAELHKATIDEGHKDWGGAKISDGNEKKITCRSDGYLEVELIGRREAGLSLIEHEACQDGILTKQEAIDYAEGTPSETASPNDSTQG